MKLSVTAGVKYGDERVLVWKGGCSNQVFATIEDDGPTDVTLVFEDTASLLRFADNLKTRAYEMEEKA